MTSLRHKTRAAVAPESEQESGGRTAQDAYLDAARAQILEVGWKRSTLTDVARRAGVSRMTIYRSWPDMERVLSDLLTREWGGVVATIVDLDESAGPGTEEAGGLADRLADGVADAVIALRANELFRRIVEVDPEVLLPYLLERRGRSQDAILDLVIERIRPGQASGAIRDGNPVLLARTLLLIAHGFLISMPTMVDVPTSSDAGSEGPVTEAHLDAEFRRTLRKVLQP